MIQPEELKTSYQTITDIVAQELKQGNQLQEYTVCLKFLEPNNKTIKLKFDSWDLNNC